MAPKWEVIQFLNDFHVKMDLYDIFFRDDRLKNTQALLDLELSIGVRREVIKNLEMIDYSEGPIDDKLNGQSELWVFGKTIKNREIYIKISLGIPDNRVICISFHPAEHPLHYPFK